MSQGWKITEDCGINLLTYWNWDDKDFGPTARDVCKSMVLISCVPDKETPRSVCASYMDAARLAGYHMVFVDRNEGQDEVEPFRKLKIKPATAQFRQDPQSFLDNVGRIWFFCKCKRNKRNECLGIIMHSITIYWYFMIICKCIYEMMTYLFFILGLHDLTPAP